MPDAVGVIQQDGQILIATPQAETETVSFDTAPVLRPRTMEVRLNGTLVQTVPFPQVVGTTVVMQLPLHKGTNLLEIHAVEGCYRPTPQDQPVPDLRCFGFYVQHLKVNPA